MTLVLVYCYDKEKRNSFGIPLSREYSVTGSLVNAVIFVFSINMV